MNNVSPLVSVIIPAYNVSECLDECISSVLSQSYSSIEVILIDDGSTDTTADKCDFWQEKDKRVQVVHQMNQGLAAARNIGLKLASGSYILNVDSDDLIDCRLIEKCMNYILNRDVDVVYYGFTFVGEKGERIKNESISSDVKFVNDIVSLLLSGILPSHSWQYLCKKELYRNILYPIGRKAEDLATTYKVMSHAQHAVLIPDCLYFYRLRLGSITNQSDADKMIIYYEDESLSFHEMLDWSKERDSVRYYDGVANSYMKHLFAHYYRSIEINSPQSKKWVSHKIKDELKVFSNVRFNRSNRLKIALYKMKLLWFYSIIRFFISELI